MANFGKALAGLRHTQMQIANRTSETQVGAIIHPEYLDGTCTQPLREHVRDGIHKDGIMLAGATQMHRVCSTSSSWQTPKRATKISTNTPPKTW